jgi:hypothetical protein
MWMLTHLIKHAGKQHVESTITLDHFLELLHDWQQLFRVLVDVSDGLINECVVVSLVLRHPLAHTMNMVLFGNT